MRTHYFLYGGQPVPHAYRWHGFPSLATRNAADTRGLSGLGDPSQFGHGQEVEYLPYRASGPEPLDPGELGDAADGLGDLSDPKTLGMIALVAAGAWWLLRKRRR